MRPRTCAAIRYGGGRQLGVGPTPVSSARRRSPRLVFRGPADAGSVLFFLFFFFLIAQSSEGLHSVSSRDNGLTALGDYSEDYRA